ncbi:GLPGLI family protein [Salegentibacter sp. F188]|uniref:GLPGLI family protein n=1 Tax=Autumnicola patrickiae TaxID=3075591 RepID=A0ABU3E5D4_9FLAO|nr:GLPGLI family protein [Salegentibacter sp. F188]MDT0691201.1 GLPGLI family protein [Salegentibacter sp. F188]
MKHFIIFLFLLSWSLQAQKGVVYYGQIKSPGMKSSAGPDLNSYLVFDIDRSYYVTAKDSLERADVRSENIYKGEGDRRVVYNGAKTTEFGEQVYFDRDKDSLWWSERFQGYIYISEKRPLIDWELKKRTKKIGNFKAKKAIGEFRGRTYTAWYTTEIPLPYGPWKLQGLPGLILEAYDESKEMYLYFKNVEYPTEKEVAISKVQRPKGDEGKWETIEDFEKMLRNSLTRAYNRMVLNAEKNGSDKPEKPVFREIYIESFE